MNSGTLGNSSLKIRLTCRSGEFLAREVMLSLMRFKLQIESIYIWVNSNKMLAGGCGGQWDLCCDQGNAEQT